MPTQSQNPIEPQPDIVGVIQTGLVTQETARPRTMAGTMSYLKQ